MNQDLAFLAEFCRQRGLTCPPGELTTIEWLSHALSVGTDELVSMFVLELLDKSPPPAGVSTLISRIKKQIVRDYEWQRRSIARVTDPVIRPDTMEWIDLPELIKSLSPWMPRLFKWDWTAPLSLTSHVKLASLTEQSTVVFNCVVAWPEISGRKAVMNLVSRQSLSGQKTATALCLIYTEYANVAQNCANRCHTRTTACG
jgi:hypothetical protein